MDKEFRLESGRRVDGIDLVNRHVYELKPNNPRAIRAGKRQLQSYLDELNRDSEGPEWTGSLVTYDR